MNRLFLVLLLAVHALAQEKKLLHPALDIAALSASIAFDVKTSEDAYRRGAIESGIFFHGGRPSANQLLAVHLPLDGGIYATSWLADRALKKRIRPITHGTAATLAAIHFKAGVHNQSVCGRGCYVKP